MTAKCKRISKFLKVTIGIVVLLLCHNIFAVENIELEETNANFTVKHSEESRSTPANSSLIPHPQYRYSSVGKDPVDINIQSLANQSEGRSENSPRNMFSCGCGR